jgi:nucleoside-diphosphate-sugar epimerase
MRKIVITGGNGFIGTNLILSMRQKYADNSASIYIIDILPPQIPLINNENWIKLDILDRNAVLSTFREVQPDFVIHLAAETSCDISYSLDNYLVNTTGSENIYTACEDANVDFLINTSTQYVNQSRNTPVSDHDYAPYTSYGESKVIAENLLRKGNYTYNWVIIRPTNVWGKWHLRYSRELWKVVREGRYFHPGRKPVIRSYAYVGNVCEQILTLLELRNNDEVARNVFYVGDQPLDSYVWMNTFSKAILKKQVKVVPRTVIFLAAVLGSLLKKVKISFPITLPRYKNITSDNPAPMEKTFRILGSPKYSIQEGVDTTTNWLFDYWKTNKI